MSVGLIQTHLPARPVPVWARRPVASATDTRRGSTAPVRTESLNFALAGHCPSNVEMMAITQARVQFNQTGNSKQLLPLLAHRRGITDITTQRQLDQKVLALGPKLNVYSTSQPIERGKKLQANQLQPADPATKLVLASQIVSMLGHKPGLLKKLNVGKLRVIVAEDNQMHGARGRCTGSGNLIINHDVLWGDVRPGDNHNTLVHELCHLLDGCTNRDGLLPDMEAKDRIRFRLARRKLYKQYCQTYEKTFGVEPNKDTNPPEKSHPWWEQKTLGQDTNGDGIRNYVFFGRNRDDLKEKREFVADTVRLFMDKPEALRQSSPALYGVYRRYFGFDPAPRQAG